MNNNYTLYGEFDVDKHVNAFPHYLEVVIDEKGKVHYAVPSHQEKLIVMATAKYSCSRDELNDMCPPEYYLDFLQWLLIQTGCISVWTSFIQYNTLTDAQVATLRLLKRKGAYEGELP